MCYIFLREECVIYIPIEMCYIFLCEECAIYGIPILGIGEEGATCPGADPENFSRGGGSHLK